MHTVRSHMNCCQRTLCANARCTLTYELQANTRCTPTSAARQCTLHANTCSHINCTPTDRLPSTPHRTTSRTSMQRRQPTASSSLSAASAQPSGSCTTKTRLSHPKTPMDPLTVPCCAAYSGGARRNCSCFSAACMTTWCGSRCSSLSLCLLLFACFLFVCTSSACWHTTHRCIQHTALHAAHRSAYNTALHITHKSAYNTHSAYSTPLCNKNDVSLPLRVNTPASSCWAVPRASSS